MDERMLQFALFLGVVIAFPVLVAVGVDLARRIVTHLRAPSAERNHSPHHPELH